jgi:hypothetical protein
LRLWRFALVALFVSALLPHGYVAAADPPRRYIVVFRDRVEPRVKTDDVERRFGFTSDFRYTAALSGFAAQLNAAQLALLRADPDVMSIAADRIMRIVDTVPIVSGDTAPTGVRRMAAATTTTAHASSTVNVAVIDSGIYLQHTDLNAVSGKNCINPSLPARDDNGHGTHVAGTIAAKNNGSGVIGIAPGTKLYAVKVVDAQGSGTDAQVVCGIDWVTANAAALKIKVANVSLGGDGVDDGNCGKTNNDVVHQAICRSVAAGVTYVVAAGNSGVNFAGNYPASYDEVLTVTAVSDFDGRPGALGSPNCTDAYFETDDAAASFSNFTTTDSPDVAHTIAGAGVCITSTKMGGGTTTMSGTSMATPHVAGAAALVMSLGVTAPGAVERLLTSTARRPGTYGEGAEVEASSEKYGAGLLDVAAAVRTETVWWALWRIAFAAVGALFALKHARALQQVGKREGAGALFWAGLGLGAGALTMLAPLGAERLHFLSFLALPPAAIGERVFGLPGTSALATVAGYAGWSALVPFALALPARLSKRPVRTPFGALVAGLAFGWAGMLLHAAIFRTVALPWMPSLLMPFWLLASAIFAWMAGRGLLAREPLQ